MAKKEFKYRGKSKEELDSMNRTELLKFLPARARRSLKRDLTDEKKKFLLKIKAAKEGIFKKALKTKLRDIIILPEMLGLTINVYNGKTYIPVIISAEMIGSYLGEYAQTRTLVKHSAPGIGATKSSSAVSVK
ncbi:30S ribosomal protein S19 [Candidatus Woesearchaeota archaeon]|nr:30S ribosomal protein S19 [Candidatus Woesearchaeota archaeon]